MKQLSFLFFALMFMFSTTLIAQERTVTGVVTSAEDGTPLPGVNVIVEGTQLGTITNIDGQFSIQVPAGTETLRFSFVGMVTEDIAIPPGNVINIAMITDLATFEEVVVTALGISRERKTLGYSATSITGDEVAVSSTISPVNALQGRISGVDIQPTDGGTFGGSRITIRGNSVLGENNQPIFVVDGVIYDNQVSGGSQWGGVDWGNQLKSLNPDEFESVTVLKGSAATALYGSRAINGVVVINTKQGQARKGIGVTFSQRMHTRTAYDGPAFQNKYGPGHLASVTTGIKDPWNQQGEYLYDSEGRPYFYRSIVAFGPEMDGKTMVLDHDRQTLVPNNPTPNNFLDLFETGVFSNTNLQLDGGNETTTFLVSASRTSESGIAPRNDFGRSSVYSRVTHDLTDFLSADVGISYSNTSAANPPSNQLQNGFFTGPFPRWYDTEKWKNQYRADHGGVHSNTYGDPLGNVPGLGMFHSLYENNTVRLEESLRLTTKLNLRLTDWFNVDVEGYLNNYYEKNEGKELGSGFANAGGRYELSHNRREQIDGKVVLNFLGDLTPDLAGSLSLGAEHWSTGYSFSGANTEGGLIVPGQYFLANSVNPANQRAGIEGTKVLNSLYGYGNLDYRDQLFLQVTGRHDWSSTLTYSDGTGNNNYFYPSVSLSWLTTETFSLPSFVSYAQLRASYAEVGNDYSIYNINSGFSHRDNLLSPSGFNLVMLNYSSNTVPNLDLKPERKKSVELGFDTRFFNNRIGIDFTYYKENTINQILNLPVPGETGVTSQLINAGNIQNQGVELSLHTRPVSGRDFRWDLDFTYTRNRNMIVALHENIDQFNLYESATYGNTRVGTVAFVGEEWGLLMSDSAPALFLNENDANDPRNGMPLLAWGAARRGASMIRSYEIQEVGNMNPDFLGSMTSTATYKGAFFRVLLDAKIGGDVVNYVGRYGAAYGLLESTLKWRDAENGGMSWTSRYDNTGDGTYNTYEDGMIPDGVFQAGTIVEGTDVSGMTYQEAYDAGIVEPTHASYWHYFNNSWGGGVINDNVVHENSYIGIRELTIGYTFPNHIASKMYLSSLRVSLFARDLGFLWKTMPDNLHPFSVRGTHSGSAHAWGAIPYVRTVGVNLDISL
jgi:iron complex outermembrane recepter protein